MLYSIRDWPNIKLRRSLTYWLSLMNRLVRYSVDVRNIEKLEKDMVVAASLMERDFPLVFNLITTHLLLHEVKTLENFGPVHSRWMFYFERLNSFITRRVMNRKCPESTAMRTIQIADFVNDVILAERLNCQKAKSNVEQILMSVDMPEGSRKRKRNVQLNPRQIQQIEEKTHSELINKEATILHKYISRKSCDIGTVTYQAGKFAPGDFRKSSRYVFVKTRGNYGEIVTIFEKYINKEKCILFEIDLFMIHEIDFETELPYSKLDCARDTIITNEKEISAPLIVGLDGDFIWFISVTHDSQFKWLEAHIANFDI